MNNALTSVAENDVSNRGERVNADDGDWTYYAHLSIYWFALPYISGKRVLDAGCGSGYGSAYLARSGARSVIAWDGSADAISFCRRRYAGDPVIFETVNLCSPSLPYQDNGVDVIFSSNVMEHLSEVDLFLRECGRIVDKSGAMIIAVPPIFSQKKLAENIKNEFHVVNLTPLGWYNKISRVFGHIQCFLHRPGGAFSDPEVYSAEFIKPANEIAIRETDFEFPDTTIDDLNIQPHNMTAIFVATQPREKVLSPGLNEQIPPDWHYGTIVAGVIREERAHFEARIQQLLDHIIGLESASNQYEARAAALAGELVELKVKLQCLGAE